MATSDNMSHTTSSRRFRQNFYLAWLDENNNEYEERCRNSLMKLREVVDIVHIFTINVKLET